MKYLFLLICIVCLTNCNQQQEIVVSLTYEEPLDPSPDSLSDWSTVPKEMQASIVSTFNRFVKSEIPKIAKQTSWKGEAWKGERVSTQLVLWSNDSITNVQAKVSDFISDKGDELPSNIAQLQFVKYVITDEFRNGCGHRKPENFAASLVADALDAVNSYAVKAKATRPLWVSIDVPTEAEPGTYHSTITLNIEGQEAQEFNLTLNVIPRTLPLATDWKFHLDLWQNPFAVARVHSVELWSKAHWNLLKPLMKNLAQAGQKAITVSLNKRPWGGQTLDQFESMIEWKKKQDGTWSYDYTIFDNWVQFMMDLGVNKQISCFSMVPWGNEFYYFDEASNEEVKIVTPPGTKEYEDLWVPFLKDFSKHLDKKGWKSITRIAMDERGPKEMKAMFAMLNKYAPEFGASFADNHKSYKLYPNQLKDLSVAFGGTIDAEDLALRKQNGYISTHYVCCSDRFPNVFTFSPPAEGVFIGWYTIAADFDGFLRWAYNSWVENPLQDSRFRQWPAGDTYLVYPGARSSIRFETLREGIQDAEKIRILRNEFSNKGMSAELDTLNNLVNQFNITERPNDLDNLIIEAKQSLSNLAKK